MRILYVYMHIVMLTCNTTMSTYKVIMLQVAFDIKSRNNVNIFHVDMYHACSGQNYVTINFIVCISKLYIPCSLFAIAGKAWIMPRPVIPLWLQREAPNPRMFTYTNKWRLRRPMNGSMAPEWLNIRWITDRIL